MIDLLGIVGGQSRVKVASFARLIRYVTVPATIVNGRYVTFNCASVRRDVTGLMVLTNAERQKRFRERRKARVDGADLPEQTRTAIDAGLAAVWSVLVRNADKVAGGLDAFPDLAAFKASQVGKPDDLLADFEFWSSEDGEPLDTTSDERSAMILAAAICRAVLLKHVPILETAKRRSRNGKAAL